MKKSGLKIKSQQPLKYDKSALLISKLGFSYPDKPDVLDEVNLKIMPGERVGIIGPNGAGKTTLFFLACGVLKPQTGFIYLYNKPLDPGKFHPEIGLLFQNPDDQLFCSTVYDDVAFGPTNMGLSKEEVFSRTKEALLVTGTSMLADRPPHHLSEGEKRMSSIAGVLAMNPDIMIYDEPCSNLDIRSRRRLINFLQPLLQTLIIASHDLEFILEVCKRVILLDKGHIIADGLTVDILGNKDLMEAHGLECPHSLTLHSIKHHNINRNKNI